MRSQLFKFYLLTLTLNLSVTFLFGFASSITTYRPDTEWQLLKLFSTHFTHHNNQHLIGNMLALGLLLHLFPNKLKTIIFAFISCILVTAAYAKVMNAGTYLGFSALLYCLPGAYFCHLIKIKKTTEAVSILVILFTYLYMISPMQLDINSSWVPMTSAHLIGFLCGSTVYYLRNNRPTTVAQSEQNSINP